MLSMLSLKLSSYFIKFALFVVSLFFLVNEVSANHESNLLYSWLHTLPSPPKALSDWNSADDSPCNWTYVSCSPCGFVTGIVIRSIDLGLPVPRNLSSFRFLQTLVITNARLTGTIPDDIGFCSSLKVLNFRGNYLTGRIPPSIGNLRKLEYLLLSNNQLTAKIPVELSNCKKLRSLLLFSNRLAGNIPAEFGRLSRLQYLLNGDNKDIVGSIPDEIGNCSNLIKLGLAGTRVSGHLPASLGKLQKLRMLSIYYTMLSGEIPPELGNCFQLVHLLLYNNKLSGVIPRELGSLQKLERLILWGNSITGDIPEEIGKCASLRILDLTGNSACGTIPWSLGGLSRLEEIKIGGNRISGTIPASIGNASNLMHLHVHMNQLSRFIPEELGKLSKLITFYAWNNHLQGSIPSTLSRCGHLRDLDLSYNFLSGNIPSGLFQLRNLKLIVLISNYISGAIPPEIGHCKNLVRLSLGYNQISGEIPREIGNLERLTSFELPRNNLSGLVPIDIGNSTGLQKIDLSSNALGGPLPASLSSLSRLIVLDVSDNRFEYEIPSSLGNLSSLNKLVLARNSFSGSIPSSLGHCSSLQSLDLSSNKLIGSIPKELGKLEALSISLNLSCNGLNGALPPQISSLNKLSVLDLSHNRLEGDLKPLAELNSIISLNISYNNFTGKLPDTKLFRQLLPSEMEANEVLCTSGQDSCFSKNDTGGSTQNNGKSSRTIEILVPLLIILTVVLLDVGVIALIWGAKINRDRNSTELGRTLSSKFTPFQTLNFTIEEVLRCLVDDKVIGRGQSGIVYRVDVDNGETIAVKKLLPTTPTRTITPTRTNGLNDLFSAEVKTLGSIRHKNIVRLLGCFCDAETRLLIYDYISNGSLGTLLHKRAGNPLGWNTRYQILLGAAQGLAYLHHDCVPPILHRDIKANNILIGNDFEPYIADFGLAKLLDKSPSSSTIPGTFGYIAPEYGRTRKITEKSDVYSYGVVMLEVLAGKLPNDPTIPDGQHVIDWVIKNKAGEVLDSYLLSRPESEKKEMMEALRIALLCVRREPYQRPTMRDVVEMLEEIRRGTQDIPSFDTLLKRLPSRKDLHEFKGLSPRKNSQENENAEIVRASSSLSSSSMPLLISASP